MTTASYFLVVKDILVTAAAVIGATTAIIGSTVAIKGLSTWRRQIRGVSDHNLCKALLISAFKYRDSISVLRHPFMPSNEMEFPTAEESKTMSVDEILNYGSRKAYEIRWSKVRDAHAEVYANLIEAEALWGKELSGIWEKVRSLESSLFSSLYQYLRHSRMKPEDAERYNPFPHESYDIIFSKGKIEDDKFKGSLEEQLNKYETYVRNKMHD